MEQSQGGQAVSDTPISDSTPHNVADLGMLCRKLERELNASTSEIERLTNKVAQLYEGAEEAKQRIKRLEELLWLSQPVCEAKEDKP
jgi:peptidoglycan hydrolase CwlO-like protein